MNVIEKNLISTVHQWMYVEMSALLSKSCGSNDELPVLSILETTNPIVHSRQKQEENFLKTFINFFSMSFIETSNTFTYILKMRILTSIWSTANPLHLSNVEHTYVYLNLRHVHKLVITSFDGDCRLWFDWTAYPGKLHLSFSGSESKSGYIVIIDVSNLTKRSLRSLDMRNNYVYAHIDDTLLYIAANCMSEEITFSKL